MSSPQQPENTQQPDASGVGALLKASRLRIGEELSEVSDVLRIRNVYLEAIEDGRYDDLPGLTYAIGFIRAYADHLGLDSDEIIRRFKDRTSGEEPSPDLVFPAPISQAGIPGGAIVFIGALVAILTYGVWYVNTSEDSFLAELISPVPDRLAKLAGEESKPEHAAPAPEPIQKDPSQKDRD
ncbi:MAG: helix-turn-helix domain-containing protein, partial [Proteobacteria bacterium]|nr:helix-turn-helix domain-containing protein [Pseudomonadota bacterium]